MNGRGWYRVGVTVEGLRLEIFKLWSASFRMPLGLGKVVILKYIEVVLGLFVMNDIFVAGSVSKRKV